METGIEKIRKETERDYKEIVYVYRKFLKDKIFDNLNLVLRYDDKFYNKVYLFDYIKHIAHLKIKLVHISITLIKTALAEACELENCKYILAQMDGESLLKMCPLSAFESGSKLLVVIQFPIENEDEKFL